MKKLTAILLMMVMVLSMAACGKSDTEPESTGTADEVETTIETEAETEETEEDKEEIVVDEDWGVQESIVLDNARSTIEVYIKFPTMSGLNRGLGRIAYQTDETLVLLSGEKHLKPVTDYENVTGPERVFPAYFEQTVRIMDDYRKNDHADFAFDIENSEALEINGYSMCKYTGNHTYTLNGEPKSIKYVALATQLKTNGAYVYWMVLDESEDQSLTDTIDEYATKMAYTLQEAE